MNNYIKKISWITLLGLFFLIGYFHQSLLTTLYQSTIQAYVLANFGCKLDYEKISMQGNRLIIHHPRLPQGNDFKADQMALSWDFSLRNKEIYISVDFDKPSWKLDASQHLSDDKLKKVFKGKKGGLKYFFDLKINNGIASWFISDQLHYVHFNAQTSNKSGGYIQASFDQTPDNQHYVSISSESTPELLAITWECHEIECSGLLTFIKLFFPELENLNVSSGTVKGQVQTHFPAMRRPYVTGVMQIENLHFAYEESFKGQSEKTLLTLKENPASNQLLTTLVELELQGPSSLSSFRHQQPLWEIQDLIGNIHVDGNKMAFLHLDTQTLYENKLSHFKLAGDFNLNSQKEFNVNLHANCSSYAQAEGQIRLLVHQLNSLEKKAEIEISNLSSTEAGFLQTLLSTFRPSFKNIELQQGTYSGFLELLFSRNGLNHLKIDHFKANQAAFKIHSIPAAGNFDQLSGKGAIALSEINPWDTLDLDFILDNGSIHLDGLKEIFPLNDIQAHLQIRKGAVHHSLITLNWMGLKGILDLEWGKDKELMTFNLDGYAHHISHLFPKKIEQALNTDFTHSHLKILGNFKRSKKHQFDLSGTVHVQRHQTDQFDLIHFGCELKKSSEGNTPWIPKGWIYAYDLPLEKFVSPFIFRRGVLKMYGNGEFKGTFDAENFNLAYNVHNLKVENDNLLIEAKDLRSDIPGQMMGYHQMNLNTYSHRGSLPIKQASYLEKNSGLKFTDINCSFFFEDDTLTIDPIETYCQGVFLAGSIFLDYRDPAPGVFTVKIDAPHLSGTVSQTQFILSHLKHTSFLNHLPLDGFIHNRGKGMQLVFDFLADDYLLQADVEAALSEGTINFDDAELALKGLYMDLDYHHDDQFLEISGIQGTLLVGKPTKAEEYLFGGNYIRLKHLTKQEIDLDVWIKDSFKELCRLKGYTQEQEPGQKEIVISPLSHLSCIQPHNFSCSIKEWRDFVSLNFESHFELSDFIHDLTQFKNTGLYCFSHSFLDKLAQLDPLNGKISLNFHFDPNEQLLHYFLESKQLIGPSQSPHQCALKGHKLGKKWIVDHFQWDDLVAHAELQSELDHIKIPFLGLKIESGLLLGLEGELFLEQNRLQSKINLCEISLKHLSQSPFLSEYIPQWQMDGQLKLSGDMRIEWLSKAPWFAVETHLAADLPSFNYKQNLFYFTKPFQVHYKTDEFIQFDNLYFNLCQAHPRDHFILPSLFLQTNQEKLSCPQLAFHIPSNHMKALGDILHYLYPEVINEQCIEHLIHLKPTGDFKGSLTLEKNPSSYHFSLKLEDGSYTLHGQNYDLKNTEFNLTPHSLQFSTISHEEKCPYHLIGKCNWPEMNQGELTFIDLLSNKTLALTPLKIKFNRELNGKLLVQSLQGYFCGMHLNLKNSLNHPSKPEMINLIGKIDFNTDQIQPLLASTSVQRIHDLELVSNFTLHGDFAYDHATTGKNLCDHIHFKGNISGKEILFQGFFFQEFSANMGYAPGELNIQSLTLLDNACKFNAEDIQIRLNPKSDEWWFNSPMMTLKDFRPYLLRNAFETKRAFSSKYRTFLIKRFDLKRCSGKFNDVMTWQAKGNFHFLNPSRKNINHPLLAIPAEIILRLGLNPQVLNPVTGTIFFDMQGDRFYLTRFKDVYSEGRGSKFYLAEGINPSWIDLKGNLNIQIKMKQYNLLFKLAELFTVSMEGNIKKPKFYLQKYKTARKDTPYPFDN